MDKVCGLQRQQDADSLAERKMLGPFKKKKKKATHPHIGMIFNTKAHNQIAGREENPFSSVTSAKVYNILKTKKSLLS